MSGQCGGVWLGIALGMLLTASPAAAQLSLGAFSGQATAHIGAALGNDEAGNALAIGGSLAVLEQSGWGAEFDFGYANSGDDPDDGLTAQSYMVNLIGAWPTGSLRPFGVAGAGAIRARTCVAGCAGSETWTDWGLSGGGGVQYLINDTAAVRADVRYVRAIGDHPDPTRSGLSFWRIGVGATLLWAIAP